MNKTQRRRTLTLTAVLVTLMMLFLGGRAFGLITLPPSFFGAAIPADTNRFETNDAEWKRESEGLESAGSTPFAVRTSDSADRRREFTDANEGHRPWPAHPLS